MTLPTKETLLARERRWLKPAGMIAIAGAFLYAAGVVVQQVGVESADTDAEQLQQFHDHSTNLLAGQALQGLGFALFAVPIYVLFQAAAGRSERVRRGLLPIAMIGPILFLVATVIVSAGIKSVADDFVEQRPAVEQSARQAAEAEQARAQGPAKPEGEKPAGQQGPATGTTATGTTGTTTAEEAKTPDEAAEDAGEQLAEDLGDDSTSVQIGSSLRITSTLALIFAVVYTSLWAMRTGLLTRFWATLGMALGVSLVLLGPLGQIGLVMWFAVLGLMLAGWWPGPRPPAWEAGVAVPWPRPGDDLGEPGGPVEGSGREVSEPPLQDDGVTAGEHPGEREPRETQGQQPRKRKLRR
jgi:hypothetical protein